MAQHMFFMRQQEAGMTIQSSKQYTINVAAYDAAYPVQGALDQTLKQMTVTVRRVSGTDAVIEFDGGGVSVIATCVLVDVEPTP